jgi:hypothetical protein
VKITLRFGATYIAMFTSFNIHPQVGAYPEFFTGWGIVPETIQNLCLTSKSVL